MGQGGVRCAVSWVTFVHLINLGVVWVRWGLLLLVDFVSPRSTVLMSTSLFPIFVSSFQAFSLLGVLVGVWLNMGVGWWSAFLFLDGVASTDWMLVWSGVGLAVSVVISPSWGGSALAGGGWVRPGVGRAVSVVIFPSWGGSVLAGGGWVWSGVGLADSMVITPCWGGSALAGGGLVLSWVGLTDLVGPTPSWGGSALAGGGWVCAGSWWWGFGSAFTDWVWPGLG